MFGLFRRKASIEDFDEAKVDGTVYPVSALTHMEHALADGTIGTAWIDHGYKHYIFKQFCPHFFKIQISLEKLSQDEKETLDFASLEDYFDRKCKEIGVSHLIARFATDYGLDLLFYTEPMDAFEQMWSSLIESNPFNVLLGVEFNAYDHRWRSASRILR